VKSKAQPEPRPILAVSTDELAQTTPVISRQFTYKHIHQSPEFLFIIIMGLYQTCPMVLNEKLKKENKKYPNPHYTPNFFSRE
jgi:hypothetical protein